MSATGSFPDIILIETADVTRETLPAALAKLRGGWKSSSLLWMQANGFPVLSGLVLNAWTWESEQAVIRFCRDRNVSELLVRIEKPGERWTRRRGGYLIQLEHVRSLVEDLTLEGVATILLEPASPYMDHFSLTSICDVDTGKIDLEVVGPGFDASDILRGDITPHERFELLFDTGTRRSRHATNSQVRRSYVVEPETYGASVRRRLAKIGARLRNPSFPDQLMDGGASVSSLEGLAEEAMNYLRRSGQTALLDHLDEYEPIPGPLLDMFLKQLLRLFRAITRSQIHWRTFSVASSFLSPDRLVIWDFFPPGDHDTTVLCSLRAPEASD